MINVRIYVCKREAKNTKHSNQVIQEKTETSKIKKDCEEKTNLAYKRDTLHNQEQRK